MVGVLLGATACGGDDVYRVVLQSGDELGRARTYWSKVAGQARNSDTVDDWARQADEVARRAQATEADGRVAEAAAAMTWDLTCDFVNGQAPADRDELTAWVQRKAANFGLAFVAGKDAQAFADMVFARIDTPDERQSAAEACKRIPDMASGL